MLEKQAHFNAYSLKEAISLTVKFEHCMVKMKEPQIPKSYML